ncbi:MAG: adenine phosphoribosyltransferase [Bacteroidetes bacterium]|nr:adenine phosphoribosyltransferase [Bacteroidota bacterium]
MSLQERLKSAIRDIPDFPKPGILFKDITPVLKDMHLCNDLVNAMHRPFAHRKVDCVAGIESRGFLFGVMLAKKFNVPFVPIRKHGKLPYKTISYKYNLEYGSAIIEAHVDAIKPGDHVLIHDDLLATGGTAAAAAELVKMLDGHVAGFAFVVNLEFLNGKEPLKKHSDHIISLIDY